jgi:peroxiredoxin
MNHPQFDAKLFSSLILTTFVLFFAACSGGKSQTKPSKPDTTTAAAASSKADTASRKLPDAPDFTLQKMDGQSFTLSDHKGQVVILNIWATWCPPCRKEIPDFIKIQKKLKDKGILFAGVSVDKKGWSAVRPFAKKYDINYPIMVDNGTVSRKYGPFRAIPVTFIINKKGKIAYAGAGMIKGKSLEKVLEKMADE